MGLQLADTTSSTGVRSHVLGQSPFIDRYCRSVEVFLVQSRGANAQVMSIISRRS